MPVRMRSTPRTAKAGSSVVASTIGDGEGVAVGVTVTETLKVAVTGEVTVIFWKPEREIEVTVRIVVVGERVIEG
jgi:hypothetical protein